MTKWTIYLLLITVFIGCKKGEEDPSISFRTRHTRMVGDWELTYSKFTHNDSTIYVRGGYQSFHNASGAVDSIKHVRKMNIGTGGDYETVITQTIPENWLGVSDVAHEQVVTETGNWNFTGDNSEAGSCSQIIFQPEDKMMSVTGRDNVSLFTIENGAAGVVYDILKLSFDEIKLTQDYTVKYVGGQDAYTVHEVYTRL